MLYYDAKTISAKQNYKFLTGAVAPRPIAWLTTLSKDSKKVNLAPFSYFSVVSSEPAIVSVAILRKNGKPKDTARNLLEQKEAVIHIVSEELLEMMNTTSASLPYKESELQLIKATLTESRNVLVPAISEAKVRLEAKLFQHIPIQPHENDSSIISDLFLLAIENYYFDETIFDSQNEYLLTEKLKPISRLAGNNYGHTSDIVTLERPI